MCNIYRLELAYRDAVKGLDLHDKCLALLLNVYLFYRCSPLNRSSLKMSYGSLGKKALIPTRVGGTRWLPHTETALHHVLTCYNAIVLQLEQMQNPNDPISKKESSAKARNFLKLLKDKRVLYWLHLLMDVVKCLSTVALCVQNKDSTLAEVWLELTSAKKILNKYTAKMKIIKNDWRSRLGDKNLTDLLLVDIVSEEVDTFDPTAAIHMWSSTGSRRPYFNETHTPKVREPEQPIPDEEIVADLVQEAEMEEIEEEEEGDQNALLDLLATDVATYGGEDDDHDFDQRDAMELQRKSYKLLLSMMD